MTPRSGWPAGAVETEVVDPLWIELNDGTHLSERVSAVRGTPRNPMNRDEVIGKARDLIVPVLGRDTATRLTDTIFDIESLTDIRILRRLLQRG